MLARGTERRDLLEPVQGYVILKAATFETGHGFALGHNPVSYTHLDVYKRQVSIFVSAVCSGWGRLGALPPTC